MPGIEWVVEAFGCEPSRLADLPKVRAFLETLIAGLNLHPIREPLWHKFPAPGGITGLVLLAESHLAVHSFPEHGSLTLNLFCCRPRAEWNFRESLEREFGADEVRVRVLDRPYVAVGEAVR
jgi:S-adenosylmethionine decarboxylase